MRSPGLLLLPALMCPFSCGRKPQSTPSGHPAPSAAAAPLPPPSAGNIAPVRATSDVEVFSAPIAAVRLAGTDVVAGLVAAEKVIRVIAFANGRSVWSRDVFRDVQWAPDAALRALAAGDGVAIVWWGLLGAKPSRTVVEVGPGGDLRGAPAEIGAAFCGTADGLAWIGPRTGAVIPVRARRWSEPDVRDVLAIAKDRDPSLVCGDHAVTVLAEGSDDLTASRFVPGAAVEALGVVLRDADFADDERERQAYSIGDDLGLVRVGASGGIAVRSISRAAGPGPWRNLRHVLSEDDEVVAVDGDASATFLVTTREVHPSCAGAGSTSESVRALRIGAAAGEETLLDLAPGDCSGTPGPFWIASAPEGPVVAWVVRRAASPSKSAPISGMAFRVVGPGGVRIGHIDERADAIVDAGCTAEGCSLAALVRRPDSDGMRPAPVRVFAYP